MGGASKRIIVGNLCTLLILVILLLVIIQVYRDRADPMYLILVFLASIPLLTIGIVNFALGKYPALLLNRLMPFISVPALLFAVFLPQGTRSEAFVCMLVDIALIVMVIITDIISLRMAKRN